MAYHRDMAQTTQPVAIAAYVRDAYLNGTHDPGEIAERYLADALAPGADPADWLLPAVRHAVGSAFSSLQAAMRGTTRRTVTANGTQRQRHNDGYVYNPDTRQWIPLGRATVSDFDAAIGWHERQIAGHEHTIEEYRGYIKQIKDAGVACLDDI